MTEGHVSALEATIAEVSALQTPRHAALVRLATTLAQQMDDSGGEPSTRLSAAYLSVLKDVGRVAAAEKPGRDDNDKRAMLAQLRAGSSERPASPSAAVTRVTRVTRPASNAGNGDAAELRTLTPPPHSIADIRERMKWGTRRASAALRAYREEETR